MPILVVNAQTKGAGVGGDDDGASSTQDEEGNVRGAAYHPRLLAVVGDGGRSSLVQACVDLDGDGDDESREEGETARPRLRNGFTQIFVGKGARLSHTYMEEQGGIVTPGVEAAYTPPFPGYVDARDAEARRPSARDTFMETVDAYVTGDDGTYSVAVMGMGGSGRSRIAVSVSLLRPGSHADVNGFVLAGGNQRTDMRTNIHHVAQGTTSRQAQRNMVGGRATSAFRGRIRVEQSAQQTDSQQLSRTILLSDRSRIWTVPSLEIIADDVKCQHGATVSDLSEEELFYLRSRGLDRETSRNMLMYAFVDEVSAAVTPAVKGNDDHANGLRNRCIRRLQNLVPKGERAIRGEFQSS